MSLGSSSTWPQFPQGILTPAPNQILLSSIHVGSQAAIQPSHTGSAAYNARAIAVSRARGGCSPWEEGGAKYEVSSSPILTPVTMSRGRENMLDWDLRKLLLLSEIQCLNLQTGELD